MPENKGEKTEKEQLQGDENISEGIRISTMQCGTMTVLLYQADIRRNSPFEERVVLPVNAFLVEHPVHGNILIDTGWASDVDDILPKHLKRFYRPEIMPGQTAREQLAAQGRTLPRNVLFTQQPRRAGNRFLSRPAYRFY